MDSDGKRPNRRTASPDSLDVPIGDPNPVSGELALLLVGRAFIVPNPAKCRLNLIFERVAHPELRISSAFWSINTRQLMEARLEASPDLRSIE